jgi:hypothetical protein
VSSPFVSVDTTYNDSNMCSMGVQNLKAFVNTNTTVNSKLLIQIPTNVNSKLLIQIPTNVNSNLLIQIRMNG